jgi:ssDNA-binding Zn-finger/Zn-ribbon topoisomerase 1
VGTLVGKRGRFGPFLGCSRYPDCDHIKREGPAPPDPLPFEVACPKNGDGHLVPRRARRTGNVFWGCSNYPRCDYTTNHEPLGGAHDADDGPLGRKGEAAICLRCGSTSEVPPDEVAPGERYPGGPPDPEALARPARGRGGGRGSRTTGSSRSAGGGGRGAQRHSRPTEPAAGA